MNNNSPNLLSRRRFLKGSVAGAALLGTYAIGIEPRWVSVEHHSLPITGLGDELVGKTLVQISDTHVGHRVGQSYLRQHFEYIDSLAPDFVLFTGDFLDDATNWHVEQGEKLLRHFPRGNIGTACVLGNHDYGELEFSTPENRQSSARLTNLFADHGLNLLRDEVVDFPGLRVVGLRDYWYGGFDRAAAAEVISEVVDRPGIVLSHNPDTVDLPIWNGYQNWVLCGHTHGGQCRFPLLGAPMTPVDNKNYVSGKYDIPGGHKMFINRGLGHTARVRFMAQPEITVFTLTKGLDAMKLRCTG